MQTYIVELSIGEDGRTVIANYPRCGSKGVYRIEIGDKIVFKFFGSAGSCVIISDITHVAVCKLAAAGKPGSPYVMSEEWDPRLAGPYHISIGNVSVAELTMESFAQPDSTIVVNPGPVDNIRMLTVMPRRLGCVSKWPAELSHLVDRGYTAIHFTPCQTAGPSHSSYSLADVLDVDPSLFKGEAADAKNIDKRWSLLKSGLDSVNPRPLMLTDVVLNHASSGLDSWASKVPEATYCLTSCPYLYGALELDHELQRFSEEHPQYLQISSEAHLEECMRKVRVILEKFAMAEYFQLDFAGSIQLFNQDSDSATPDLRSPGWQAISQVGTSRTQKIIVDLRGHCWDLASAWTELHSVKQQLDSLARESFSSALGACASVIRYERLEVGKIDAPLLPRYFSQLANGDFAVNNGWVMNWPAGIDFASPGHHMVYLKRHVVAWGDCVKLRYGPLGAKIFNVMEEYCSRIAATFDGVRLDNCHSTPLPVLKHLIQVMRKINPNIIIIAELFTGDAANDVEYECSLGIDLMVRECMQVHSVDEVAWKLWGVANNRGIADVTHPDKSVLIPVQASCILYDSTHDNSSAQTKFGSFMDSLPLAAAVCASQSAVGSSVGFDELATAMPSVVTEPGYMDCDSNTDEPHSHRSVSDIWIDGCKDEHRVRVFGSWDAWQKGLELEKSHHGWVMPETSRKTLNLVPGVTEFKFVTSSGWRFNSRIGVRRALVGGTRTFNNVYGTVGEFASLKRELLLLHSKIRNYAFFSEMHGKVPIVKRMNPSNGETYIFLMRFKFDSGNTDKLTTIALESEFDSVVMATVLSTVDDSGWAEIDSLLLSNYEGLLVFPDPSTELQLEIAESKREVRLKIPTHGVVILRTKCWGDSRTIPDPALDEIINPSDFSFILFCCDQEESCYDVPGHGKLLFAGLAGIAYEIESLIQDQAAFLASPLAENIRKGDWLFDFLTDRLSIRFPGLYNWLHRVVRPVYSQTPVGLKPKTFVEILYSTLYSAIRNKWSSTFAKDSDSFRQNLIMASFQFTAGRTVAAGLPFFSSGYMRCWGRDTFIAFAGLFLVTKRFAEARECILAFARVVRHGLIPNLFDEGNNPRYNSRDAAWCFLHAIVQFIEFTNDRIFLGQKVTLKFPDRAFSFSSKLSPSTVTLRDVVLGILLSHLQGISFIEENAGPQVDQHMKERGFHVDVHVDGRTGLIIGGNELNCGTWMDKMGSSEKTGNGGIPATSRFGANIEINGLALRVLHALSKWEDFILPTQLLDWLDRLGDRFDKSFWNENTEIYNDTVLGDPKGDKLRPNGLFALSVVPKKYIDPTHAQSYLTRCEESLLGPLGMRTLAASDPDYNGWYNNSDDSCGYNYHNGPEWVWLFGHFVIACKKFSAFSDEAISAFMEPHARESKTSPWRSLPELTNMNGNFCEFSCPSQAWSVCCLLEATEYLQQR